MTSLESMKMPVKQAEVIDIYTVLMFTSEIKIQVYMQCTVPQNDIKRSKFHYLFVLTILNV